MPRASTSTLKPKTKTDLDIERAIVEPDSLAPTSDPVIAYIPSPTDPEWQDYVLSQFLDGDKDKDGNPSAEACRIVVEKLLGPIVAERVRTVQVPTASNDYRATVEASVSIAWGGDTSDVRVFDDVADVYPGNADPKFAQFPTASAKTKALGRAFKSALKLKRVYTTEEMATGEVPVPGGGFVNLITVSQQRFIDKVCRELDINQERFINMGSGKYSHVMQVPRDKAENMIKHLDNYQKNTSTIPQEIRGY
jgi:predicted nucleic-acid-binding Zn-ribbon protein